MKSKITKMNQSYIDNGKSTGNYSSLRRKLLTKMQNPNLIVITCSDSRVVPEVILNSDLGEVFTIRVAGNVLTEGVLGSIEYGVEHLHTKDILVLGHTHCGAIHAATTGENGFYVNSILNIIRKYTLDEKDEYKATLLNIKGQAEFIEEKFKEANVIQGIYDIESGRITIL